MARYLLEAFLQIGICLPFIFLLLKNYNNANYIRLAIFTLCYISYQLVLVLPKFYTLFDFIHSNWNWDGKLLGILWGGICYVAFKKHFSENNFFTFKQNKNHLKKTITLAALLVILTTIIWFVLGKSKFNLESLAFQLSLPGVDEEIMFRGILLGLLMSSLKDKLFFIGNSSVLITAVLFGLMHALTLNESYSLNFDSIYFIQTGFAGYVWGWITIKSRSILLAILSHNFSNFFGALSSMLK